MGRPHESTDAWRAIGDSIGLVVGGSGTKSWCCSGGVIATQPEVLFLTNFHCGAPDGNRADEAVWSPEVCSNTVIDFAWDDGETPIEFTCDGVVYRDPLNDAVVLRLRSLGSNSSPPPLVLRKGGISTGGRLHIIHHPECAPKRITSRECVVRSSEIKGWRPDPSLRTSHTFATPRQEVQAHLYSTTEGTSSACITLGFSGRAMELATASTKA